MPNLSSFYGIKVRMYYSDHNPPHFHAKYSEDEASIEIATGDVIEGGLPRRALNLVVEWLQLHREELELNWERARRQEPLDTIDPLS